HAHPALRYGSYRRLPSPAGSDLYLFFRDISQECLLVAVNTGDNAASASVHEPNPGRHFETLWGTGAITSDGDWIRMALPPRAGVVWQRRN
ncbi:MAG: DUF3459 domain-containing protein, partial [Acidimicrobiia bacterium]|nr:DUF3459 domain-containing protein [Acidimicrobiia bacterium]